MKVKKEMIILGNCDRCKRKIKFEKMYVVRSRHYTWHIRKFCTECTHSVEEAKEISIRLRNNQTMMEVKFDEEQRQIIEKFLKYVDNLIDKYSQMEDKFQITIEKIKSKTYFSEEDIEVFQKQITYVIEKLKKVSDIVRYYDCNVHVQDFLKELYYAIHEANFALLNLEECSSWKIHTLGEADILERNYKTLEKNFNEALEQYKLSKIEESRNSTSEGILDYYHEAAIVIPPDNSYI